MIRDFFDWFKGIFSAPSAESIALCDLEECKRRLLDAHSTREYAQSMCSYYEVKIDRLTAYLHSATESKQ